MEVTRVLYEFVSQVLLFPSQLTCVQQTDHTLLIAQKTRRESREDMKGLFNDVVFEKVFVCPKFIIL